MTEQGKSENPDTNHKQHGHTIISHCRGLKVFFTCFVLGKQTARQSGLRNLQTVKWMGVLAQRFSFCLSRQLHTFRTMDHSDGDNAALERDTGLAVSNPHAPSFPFLFGTTNIIIQIQHQIHPKEKWKKIMRYPNPMKCTTRNRT